MRILNVLNSDVDDDKSQVEKPFEANIQQCVICVVITTTELFLNYIYLGITSQHLFILSKQATK